MFLESPIGNCDSISSSICEKSESLKILSDRICYLHTQDAFLLLHYSFTIPKLLYTLRTAPCFLSEELQVYDDLLMSITSNITNNSLRNTSPAWGFRPLFL